MTDIDVAVVGAMLVIGFAFLVGGVAELAGGHYLNGGCDGLVGAACAIVVLRILRR